MASVETLKSETPAMPDRTTESGVVSPELKSSETNRRPRRKPSRFRKIPRTPTDWKSTNVSRLPKGDRQRTASVSSAASGRSQRRGGKLNRRRTTSEASTISEGAEQSPMRKLRDTIADKFQKKGLNLLNSYIKNRMELAKFDNTTSFLERCDVLKVVPNKYRLSNSNIKNTKHVIRTLDRSSFNMMFADLKYNRKRRFQVNKLLTEKEDRMREVFGDSLVTEILRVTGEAFDRRFNRIREQQTRIFELLLKEYNISDEEKADIEKRVEEREHTRQERRSQKLRTVKPSKTSGDLETKEADGDNEPKSVKTDADAEAGSGDGAGDGPKDESKAPEEKSESKDDSKKVAETE